eukprot:CAMPEP_0184316436 /NCGR_PEP_ID=MMETSP1049-20130417/90151_1 /TAXON_ID=77928 /ORGANISM="Proteomonas sulcata, Strain CCMP704" /LENGTH=116 /DNA_ID=CAMNT_0026635411 /DNA_START=363 /DNA_END=713 /DNA_ORIENTATION=-
MAAAPRDLAAERSAVPLVRWPPEDSAGRLAFADDDLDLSPYVRLAATGRSISVLCLALGIATDCSAPLLLSTTASVPEFLSLYGPSLSSELLGSERNSVFRRAGELDLYLSLLVSR